MEIQKLDTEVVKANLTFKSGVELAVHEVALKVNELVEAVNTLLPSKPSEEGVQGPNAIPSGYGHVDPRDAEAIRADERATIVKQIEEFAHKEMKDGNWAYEKLLILLSSLK